MEIAKSKNIIFCDFDGTITLQDTIDSLLQKYADKSWEEIEQEWVAGQIGSRECLEKQIQCMPIFSEMQFQEFVDSIEIDESFINFYKKVLDDGIPFFIVSDGFDLIIKAVFKKYKLVEPVIYSNKLVNANDTLIASFPMSNKDLCLVKAGMCKCSIIEKEKSNIIYIGDGRSDLCASRLAHKLYAKGKLQKMCDEANRPYFAFSRFEEIDQNFFGRK